MDIWNSKVVGDGVEAFQPNIKLQEAYIAFAKLNLGVPENGAVFSSYDRDANAVTWYFSPELKHLAEIFEAKPCSKPLPSEGFGLLVGEGRSWEAHFSNYLSNRRHK